MCKNRNKHNRLFLNLWVSLNIFCGQNKRCNSISCAECKQTEEILKENKSKKKREDKDQNESKVFVLHLKC